MAIVSRKSTYITNRDASPTVPVGAGIAGGLLRESTGFVTAANGDSATSIYPMVSLPSNARVNSVRLQTDAMGTGAKIDVGVYYPTNAPAGLGVVGGAAISAAFFASALAVATATALTDITNSSGSNTLDKQEMELWQAIGLATDPGCMLDISVAVNVAMAAAGKIGLKVGYVQ